MKRELTVDDLVVAGIALAVGLLAAFLLRMLLRWLGRHADRTRWSGDDVIVDALRTVVPWSAFTGGAAAAAAALPLTKTVGHNVNQTLTVLLIAVTTLTTARVVSTLVRTVTQSRSAVAYRRRSSSTSSGSSSSPWASWSCCRRWACP